MGIHTVCEINDRKTGFRPSLWMEFAGNGLNSKKLESRNGILFKKEVFMPDGKEIRVNFPPNLQGGVYSNNMVVAHTKEEFILDFRMVAPPTGVVASRVIVSPGHMKRILTALQDNVSKYEKTFGPIQIAEEPRGKILS
jgi:hypothetical protein